MPDYFAALGDCGSDVLARQAKSLWLVKSSGRIQLVAETDRPTLTAYCKSPYRERPGPTTLPAKELVSAGALTIQR